jgi:membrane protein
MPRARAEDNLLLMAATAILVLSAQHYFQVGSQVQSAGMAATPAGSLPLESDDRTGNPPAVGRTNWTTMLWRLYERSNDDRLLATAGGVVFFGLLAVFPAVTALVSSYGLFADPATIGSNLQALALMLPEGSFQIVQDQIARVLAKGPAALGGTFLFGLALALWSANAGVKSIIDALNVAYEVRETRSFIRLNLLSLALTAGAIAALLVMVSAVVAFPLAFSHFGSESGGGIAIGLARWPLLFAVLLVALSVLYRFGPDRSAARLEWMRPGTLVAALLWIAGSAALSWYLSNFGNYNATYGSLGAAIGLMVWMWMSATIVLFGAELNSEIERQSAPDCPRLRTVPSVPKEH